LLTPVLPSAAAGEDYYPNLQYETRQVAFILGENDRDNCPLTELYKFLGTCAKAFPVVVLAGAHSFELGYDDKNPLQKQVNDYNTKTAVESTMFWLRTFEYPHLNK
jgi:hypothetical protein